MESTEIVNDLHFVEIHNINQLNSSIVTISGEYCEIENPNEMWCYFVLKFVLNSIDINHSISLSIAFIKTPKNVKKKSIQQISASICFCLIFNVLCSINSVLM